MNNEHGYPTTPVNAALVQNVIHRILSRAVPAIRTPGSDVEHALRAAETAIGVNPGDLMVALMAADVYIHQTMGNN